MQIRCPHCHTIFADTDTGYCCRALEKELAELARRSKQPAKSRWLWNAQHTVDWVAPEWIETSNRATAGAHPYSWECKCENCTAVRAARGFSLIRRRA